MKHVDLYPQTRICAKCGAKLLKAYNRRRRIVTLTGTRLLIVHFLICRNAKCGMEGRPIQPEAEKRLALPRFKYVGAGQSRDVSYTLPKVTVSGQYQAWFYVRDASDFEKKYVISNDGKPFDLFDVAVKPSNVEIANTSISGMDVRIDYKGTTPEGNPVTSFWVRLEGPMPLLKEWTRTGKAYFDGKGMTKGDYTFFVKTDAAKSNDASTTFRVPKFSPPPFAAKITITDLSLEVNGKSQTVNKDIVVSLEGNAGDQYKFTGSATAKNLSDRDMAVIWYSEPPDPEDGAASVDNELGVVPAKGQGTFKLDDDFKVPDNVPALYNACLAIPSEYAGELKRPLKPSEWDQLVSTGKLTVTLAGGQQLELGGLVGKLSVKIPDSDKVFRDMLDGMVNSYEAHNLKAYQSSLAPNFVGQDKSRAEYLKQVESAMRMWDGIDATLVVKNVKVTIPGPDRGQAEVVYTLEEKFSSRRWKETRNRQGTYKDTLQMTVAGWQITKREKVGGR